MTNTIQGLESFDRPQGLYDSIVAAIGYESRARFFSESVGVSARFNLATGFSDRHVLSYEDNRRFFSNKGFNIVEPADSEFSQVVRDHLEEIAQHAGRTVRIAVDISSQTRSRMASWLSAFRDSTLCESIVVDFVYSCAKFSPPPSTLAPNLSVGPLRGFAGWDDPDRPTAAVVGVGYEHNKALGAVRFVDPEQVWAFVPTGHDQEYTAEIEQANKHLWDLIPDQQRYYYNVFRPLETLINLESFVCGLRRNHKVLLLPFGPKIFALASLMVACMHTEVPVWRVSSGAQGEPSDRLPNGRVVGIRAEFRTTNEPQTSNVVGDRAI